MDQFFTEQLPPFLAQQIHGYPRSQSPHTVNCPGRVCGHSGTQIWTRKTRAGLTHLARARRQGTHRQ